MSTRAARNQAADEPRTFALGAPVTGFASTQVRSVVAAALGDGTVRLIPFEHGAPPMVSAAHRGAVLCVAFHPPSRSFLTGADDGRLCRAGLDGDHEELADFGGKWVEHLLVEPTAGRVAVAAGREVHVLTRDFSSRCKLGSLPSTVAALMLDRAGERLAAAHYGGVSLVRFDASDEDNWSVFAWKGSHLAAAVSPDGRWLVSGTQENDVHVWPLGGGPDYGMRGYPAKPRSLSWTADSKLLLTSGLDSAVAWSFDGAGPQGREPLLLGGSGGGLTTFAAAHPTAPAAAFAFDDGGVMFADLGEGRAAMLTEPDGREITALSWTADGLALLVGYQDGGVTVFDIAD